MLTVNARVAADNFTDEYGNKEVVVRLGEESTLTMSLRKSRSGPSGRFYDLTIQSENEPQQNEFRGLSFEGTTRSVSIQFKQPDDLQQIKAALLSAVKALDMYEDEADFSAEEIATCMPGFPNHKAEQSVFDESGEPRLYQSLFTKGGELIRPELPFPHPLNARETGQFSNYRTFNHLRVTNLNAFLTAYGNTIDYYESPFAMLADLESQINYEDFPESDIAVSYKPDGDFLFKLVAMYQDGNRRIVEYTYTGSVS